MGDELCNIGLYGLAVMVRQSCAIRKANIPSSDCCWCGLEILFCRGRERISRSYERELFARSRFCVRSLSLLAQKLTQQYNFHRAKILP